MRSDGVTQLLDEYQFLVADFTVTSHGAVPNYELNNGSQGFLMDIGPYELAEVEGQYTIPSEVLCYFSAHPPISDTSTDYFAFTLEDGESLDFQIGCLVPSQIVEDQRVCLILGPTDSGLVYDLFDTDSGGGNTMTVKMIKLELKKAFTTPWFYLSLAVLMLCALMSTVYSIDSYQNIRINGFPHYFENGKMTVNEYYATWNCYQKWIGSELVSLASTLFFTLLPVCAVLPYASAFHQERKVGYLRVMLPQCGKKSYFLAKTMGGVPDGGRSSYPSPGGKLPGGISVYTCHSAPSQLQFL